MIDESKVKRLLKNRPVLVTGADGFVGSHLTEKLLHYKANVQVFIRATSSGSLYNLSKIQKEIKISRGDLYDKNAVLDALKVLKKTSRYLKTKPIIFHLGAQAHVGESWQRPYETLVTNVIGTVNIFQSLVDLNLELFKIDVAGSSEEYGNVNPEMKAYYRYDKKGGLLLDEKTPINPQSVYATSKVATDFLARNYFAAYNIPTVVSRMFNNYGPRQNPRFITGTIISQAFKRENIQLGDIRPKRDFCFVLDGVMGHIHAALFGQPGQVYAFGSGETISIADWYKLIMKIGIEEGYWGKKKLFTHTKGRGRLGKSEVEELRVDYTKLQKLTGWRPQYSWEEGLRQTIKWYAANKRSWIRKVDWL